MTDQPEPTSDTGIKLEKPGVFKKGYDPRRNLRGVPAEAIKARHMLRRIAAELIHVKEKTDAGEIVEYDITRAYAMLRTMFASKAPADRQNLLKALWPGLLKDEVDVTTDGEKTAILPSLPADVIAPSFVNVYRDSRDRKHMEYLLKGGRGSTKSSFASLDMVYLLVNNPGVHALALRQVANTLRDSVYSQIVWAIGMLGLTEKFKCLTSPLEIEYIPTKQKIYFRGADKPEMIKSIKPVFGHIGILWFEELDQYRGGAAAIRKIEQSVLRGGEEAWEFKTYNPPPTASNWVNRYVLIPKENQLQHHSTYLDVPPEWLGQTFLDEAEHLKEVSPTAYRHEYLGEITGTGGLIFGNVEIRKITDEEIFGKDDGSGHKIGGFDRIHFGLDWGYALDPLHWIKLHYDARKEIIYIFDEFRAHKMGNRELYEVLTEQKGMTPADMIIADSAEPKSIADMREYGLSVRGAEKGPDSVRYSMRWLENRAKIVIDNRRAPFVAEEILNYEYEQNRDGEFVSEYPDKENHGIDALRYALNLIWRRRGQ